METWMNVTDAEWQQLLDDAVVVICPALLDVQTGDHWWAFCPSDPTQRMVVQAVHQNTRSTSIRAVSPVQVETVSP